MFCIKILPETLPVDDDFDLTVFTKWIKPYVYSMNINIEPEHSISRPTN